MVPVLESVSISFAAQGIGEDGNVLADVGRELAKTAVLDELLRVTALHRRYAPSSPTGRSPPAPASGRGVRRVIAAAIFPDEYQTGSSRWMVRGVS